jgi:hypothetical protein
MNGTVVDVWLDLERHLARTERDGQVDRVIGPEKIALLRPDGRYGEALYSNDLDEPLIGLTLGYLARIVGVAVESNGVEATAVDGAAAIKVRVQQEAVGEAGHQIERAEIYLDETFLPLKMELDLGTGGSSRSSHTFRSEYVARDAVPADFFSFEHVRAKAKTSEDVLREAAKPYGRTYWLGEPFEGMVVERVSGMSELDGEPSLDLDYRPPNDAPHGPDEPYPCARIVQHTRRGWDETSARRTPNPDTPERIERGSLTVLGGEARIFEQPADRVLPPPQIEGEPPPRIPTLAESSQWIAEIAFEDVVVEVDAGCGPPGGNVYRSLDGIRHLLDSLQVLEME